jgi:quercetin dioxygenase-like cupin family protein
MKRFARAMSLGVLIVILVMPLAVPQGAFSQEYACPDIVVEALTTTDEACGGAGRNQACYGYAQLTAEPQSGVEHFVFDQEGDIADVFDIQSLRLSAMNVEQRVFGIALMRLQANLPDATPRENITLLLFGEVEVENAVEPVALVEVAVRVVNVINVRYTPSTQAKVISTVAPNDTLMATGRLADSSWLRVRLPQDGRAGWIKASLLSSKGDIETLSVVEPSSVYYSPMQAFYFQSGADDAVCPEAPNSGLLIQTPEGVAEVTFLINEVDIQLGSTVYFQSQPGGDMTVRVVEGSARVTAFDTTYKVIPGSQVTVPMNENKEPSGPPTPPKAYDMADVQSLPIGSLERAIVIHPPATAAELAALNSIPESAGTGGDMVAVCHEGNTITISADALDAHLAHGDTSGACPGSESEKVTICRDGNTITISADALDAQLAAGATLGACPGSESEKVTICRDGKTITISADALDAQLAAGATLGACPDGGSESEKVTICRNGKTVTIDASALDAQLAAGATLGACP